MSTVSGSLVWKLAALCLPPALCANVALAASAKPAGGSADVGAVANHQWDYAGWTDKNVNALLIQPFVNYNLRDAATPRFGSDRQLRFQLQFLFPR